MIGDLNLDATFAEAINAIREIVEARQKLRPPSAKLRGLLSSSLSTLQSASRDQSLSLKNKTELNFMHAMQLTERAIEDDDPEVLREAARTLFFASFFLTRQKHYNEAALSAAVTMATLLGRPLRKSRMINREIERRAAKLASIPPDFDRVLAGINAQRFEVLSERISRSLTQKSQIRIPGYFDLAAEPSAAELLAAAARQQTADAAINRQNPRESPREESLVRIEAVTLQGFRGAPEPLIVKFRKNDLPVSAIIFGENGVGKSTIVDAMEFALQGRVGRSMNFDSTLAPSIRSLASTNSDAAASVELNDGAIVKRSVSITHDGRIVAEPRSVRKEFRIAPISIKRSDILRFLDTEALERGAVLLDYFPADAGQIAMRPEEEVHQLKGEMAELRIKRSAYAGELSKLLGVEKSSLANAGLLKEVVREKIMGGLTEQAFNSCQGWDKVDPEIQESLANLMRAQKRLREIMNRMQRTTEILNPLPYKEQAATLAGILNEVSEQLSTAFRSVAHEHPVEHIDVVFGESGPLSLDLVLRLEDGTSCFPQQLFSEAYQDLLALLFFVAVSRKASERGQAKVMLLDDVLQSVDSKVRHTFVAYLLDELADWQLIFTVHDRLWRDQLRDLFDASRHAYVNHSIQHWSFSEGPKLAKPNVDSLDRDLRAAISNAEPRTTALLAGQLLEVLCNQLTWRLSLQVTRREGDRYTLGDLWPVVHQRLAGTAAEPVIKKIAGFKKLRNLTAHATLESLGLTSVDAENYAHAVLSLLSSVKCRSCQSWIQVSNSKCSCGNLSL
jgi:recombinational DNA repair ATPase RecF